MKPSAILSDFAIVAGRKLAVSSEQSYRTWIGKFLDFLKSPAAAALETSERKVEVFLSFLRLIVSLLYACGLRVSEVCLLRIKDFDLERQSLTVFEGKGDKDRQVRIPDILLPAIRKQLAIATARAEIDIAERQPVQLPGRLDKKYPSYPHHRRLCPQRVPGHAQPA